MTDHLHDAASDEARVPPSATSPSTPPPPPPTMDPRDETIRQLRGDLDAERAWRRMYGEPALRHVGELERALAEMSQLRERHDELAMRAHRLDAYAAKLELENDRLTRRLVRAEQAMKSAPGIALNHGLLCPVCDTPSVGPGQFRRCAECGHVWDAHVERDALTESVAGALATDEGAAGAGSDDDDDGNDAHGGE